MKSLVGGIDQPRLQLTYETLASVGIKYEVWNRNGENQHPSCFEALGVYTFQMWKKWTLEVYWDRKFEINDITGGGRSQYDYSCTGRSQTISSYSCSPGKYLCFNFLRGGCTRRERIATAAPSRHINKITRRKVLNLWGSITASKELFALDEARTERKVWHEAEPICAHWAWS